MEDQGDSGQPMPPLAMAKLLRTRGKGANVSTPAPGPLYIPDHLLKGTYMLPSNPPCLGPPERPSAPPGQLCTP